MTAAGCVQQLQVQTMTMVSDFSLTGAVAMAMTTMSDFSLTPGSLGMTDNNSK